MSSQSWNDWFEHSCTVREETLYRELFHNIGPGIYPLEYDLFASGFRQGAVDPRWLSHGVFECPPGEGRQNWLYVSSGLSNPWEAKPEDANEMSGLGCEFILQTAKQSAWALVLLQKMVALQILLSCRRFPGKEILKVWDRLPLHSPIDGLTSALEWVVFVPSPTFGGPHHLPSGNFEFVQLVGITADEAEYAQENEGAKLLNLLTEHSAAPVVVPDRLTVLSPSAK